MFPSNLRSRNCQRPDPQKEIVVSDHVNRTPKGRTHGSPDQACDVKISLANPEPSTHGTNAKCRLHRAMSAIGVPEVIYSGRVFRILTHIGHRTSPKYYFARPQCLFRCRVSTDRGALMLSIPAVKTNSPAPSQAPDIEHRESRLLS